MSATVHNKTNSSRPFDAWALTARSKFSTGPLSRTGSAVFRLTAWCTSDDPEDNPAKHALNERLRTEPS